MLATGLSVEEAAKKEGFTKQTFYRAINGTTSSKVVRSVIESICAHVTKIDWPEPAGKRKE